MSPTSIARRTASIVGIRPSFGREAAGAIDVLVITLFPQVTRLNPWPWLSVSLGLATFVFRYLAWRPAFSRKGDVGVLISISFGLLTYMALTQIALTILEH